MVESAVDRVSSTRSPSSTPRLAGSLGLTSRFPDPA